MARPIISDYIGRELYVNTYPSNMGPTGVTTTGSGDLLASLGSFTTRNIRHWWDIQFMIGCGTANAQIQFLLWDSTGGVQVAQAYYQHGVPTTATAILHTSVPFTPAAGTRDYQLRWRGVTGGASWTVYNGSYLNGMVTIREANV